ncbi:hypothetical protein AUC70_05755 [Methyloceanibacter stevinii]|uniref:HEPN AbiU2-like domain-containing protein n=1 Tax=Methyloceanibacter stevinii TaxID=1774970 RepID=A0A1E3VNU2_9HYPH|nr:hypothetical protein [Methyloceanibacter stevinii]ODR95203.1 hypothetical protein AUC70_05755 [Methyloceanibacter stevinii]
MHNTDMKYVVAGIASFVRNAQIKRALQGCDPEPRLNFWRVLYGDCLDMAVIEWSKLFGSDSRQPVHWKTIIHKDEHDKFRKGLLEAIGIPESAWQDYWNRMKGYRDNHAAHFNEEYLRPRNKPRYPDLSVALEAAYFYYDRLLPLMSDRGIAHSYPKDIREYSQRFGAQARQVATKALAATADMEERVR